MFNNKKVLITGGTGSWANELVKQLLESYSPTEIRLYSRGEQKQVEMKHRFGGNPILKFVVGDVRDSDRLEMASKDINYIFHTAALKHVPVCEENPWEAVLTNIQGTKNVTDAAIKNKVAKVILISSDKAVDPLNLYGTTKQCAEKLIIAANNLSKSTRFVCVRGGNVLGTAGSVVPLFREQIRKNNEITLTDDRMTRFYLTLKQAIHLVFKSIENSIGGEVFVLNMPATKITDMAKVMISNLGDSTTKIRRIGVRPGEKMHEVLISRYESERTLEEGSYFIILPNIPIDGIAEKYSLGKKVSFEEFTSENTRQLLKDDVQKMLDEDGWLGKLSEVGFLGKINPQDLKFEKEKWL